MARKKIEEVVSNNVLADYDETQEERVMRIIDEAAEKGVKLSDGLHFVTYEDQNDIDPKTGKPGVKEVRDISKLTTEKWEEIRGTGIGGSDAGVIYGTNHYKDIEVLAREKLGLLPKEQVDWKTQARFDMGHEAEKVISKMFGELSGFKVMEDRAMYRHSAYPCMIADVDGVAIDKQGMKVGLEFKFINPDDLKFKWTSGVYGKDAKAGNESYITQCRHYMSVLNIDRYYICVWGGNDANNLVVIRIDRDFDIEKELIQKEVEFWNNIQNGRIPHLSAHTDVNDERLTSGMKFPKTESAVTPETVDGFEGKTLSKIAAEYQQNVSLKKSLNEKIKKIDEKQNALSETLKKAISDRNTDEIVCEDDDRSFLLSVSSHERTTIDAKKLKLRYPKLYTELANEKIIKTIQTAPSLKVKEA